MIIIIIHLYKTKQQNIVHRQHEIASTTAHRPKEMKLIKFYVPLDTKQVILETFFLANLLA